MTAGAARRASAGRQPALDDGAPRAWNNPRMATTVVRSAGGEGADVARKWILANEGGGPSATPIVSCVAAASSTMPTMRARPTATGTGPATATTTSGFGRPKAFRSPDGRGRSPETVVTSSQCMGCPGPPPVRAPPRRWPVEHDRSAGARRQCRALLRSNYLVAAQTTLASLAGSGLGFALSPRRSLAVRRAARRCNSGKTPAATLRLAWRPRGAGAQ